MSHGVYRFGAFQLDAGERLLRGPDGPIDLNARYFDALALMVREPGRLIAKDRFMAEVWAGVPVGDEALTQCMAALRRCLGDSARNPRFIQTVPKHGYRFLAEVDSPPAAREAPEAPARPLPPAARVLALAAAGTAGGGAAGVAGGLIYGAAIALSPAAPQVGAVSVFMLVGLLNIVVGLAGGLAVSLGWAAALVLGGRAPVWPVLGAAAGGFVIGAATSLLGLDVFHLLLGQAPERMTGGLEGAALGAALALGLAAGRTNANPLLSIAAATAAAALAGALIVLLGGALMAGSLDSLSFSIAGSAAPLERIAPFFAAVRFDGPAEVLLGAMEGALFGACAGAALALTRRALAPKAA